MPKDPELESDSGYDTDGLLSQEQIDSLTSQPDRGIIRPEVNFAEVKAEDFSTGQVNFVALWASKGLYGELQRSKAAYQRFIILYPELDDYLREAFKEGRNHNLENDSRLLQAYKAMTGLVDVRDRSFSSLEPDEQAFYLTA